MASTNDSTRPAAGSGHSDLYRLISRFDEAWQRGDRPSIPDFLEDAGGHASVLVELIHRDLKHRLESGEAARVEHYLEGFPELRDDTSSIMDLVATEYDVRKARDGEFPMAEYVARFPQMAADLISFLIAPKRRDHTLVLEKDQSKQVTETPGLQNTIIEPSLSAMIKTQEQAETLFHSDSKSDGDGQPAALRTNVPGYEILGELGRGGMGVVYKARQLKLKRLVALKMIISGQHAGQKDLLRFQGEAEVIANLNSPNIVQIYDVSEHEGFPYFALEYIDGGTLSDKVAGTPMDAAHAAQLMRAVAVAVHSAHQKGIVHRDLKPDNILLTTDGVPKITDFGLAKTKSESGRNTQTGTVMGTPGYMAPEQALGKTRDVGPASDLYSLGAIFYEMLTGRPPFRGETPVDTMLLVVSEEPTSLAQINPGVPKDLETICLKCLQKEIEHRYGSTQELADELGRFLNNEPILAQPITRVERVVRWCKRNAAIVTVSSLAALLFVALGGALIYKINNPTQVTVLGPQAGGVALAPGDNGEVAPAPKDESMLALEALEDRLDTKPDVAALRQMHADVEKVLTAREPEPPPASRERAKWLDALLGARSEEVKTRRDAAAEIKQWLAQPNVYRPDRLCEAVTLLAQENPPIIPVPEALQLLRATAEQRQNFDTYIKAFIRTLQTEQVRQHVVQSNLDWKAVLKDCDEANREDGWVLTARVEALLEGAGGTLSPRERANAARPLGDIASDAPAGPYAAYVQAVAFNANEPAKAIAKLIPVFQKDPLPAALTVPHRQKRAAEILVSSALKQRTGGDANPFGSPFSPGVAEAVYDALKLARNLYLKANVAATAELNNNLALAAWFKKSPDTALARELANQIPANQVGSDDALRLQVLKIKLNETRANSRKDALLGYERLLTELAKYLEKKNQLWEPKKWFDTVVEPGIKVGEQLKVGPKSPYDQRHVLAQLYMRKGMLIGQDETVVAAEPYKHIKDAYERALSLDDKMSGPERGRCIVKRDIAQMWLQQVNLEQFEQDAKSIQQVDPKSAGSHYLLGYVRAEEARRASGRKDRPLALKKLAEAKDEFTQAINLLNENGDAFKDLPAYYMERANNWITQSMFERDSKNRIRFLEEAVNDAKDALRREPENPDLANEQLGIAYEELAWREGQVERYAEAVAAFDDARRKVGKSRYWVALARCKFKCLEAESAKSDRPHAQFLPEGVKHLETILEEAQKGDRKLEPQEKAEAYYWLGKLHALNNSPADAEKAFDAVEALSGDAKARRWVSFALKDNAESLLTRAETLPDAAAVKQLVGKVKAKAEEYSKLSVEDAARTSGRLLGRTALLEKKPAEALTRYQQGFKKESPRADEWTMRLGRDLLTLLLDTKWKVDIRGKAGSDYESVAKLGDELARLSDEVPMFRTAMYGLAGEAHARAADPDDRKQKDAHLQEAVKKLTIAVQSTQPGDNDGWRWRFELAKVYRDLKDSKNQAKAYELAQEALKKGNVPAARKTELQKLMNELKPAAQ